MKHLCTTLATVLAAVLHAAVPLRWSVETSRAQGVQFDAYHGETLALEASLQSYGKPLAVTNETVSIYWQTNGMADAWWSAPAAFSNNVLRAEFTPAMDPGAPVVRGFLGVPGEIYRAEFHIRFRSSPGFVPNELPLPVQTIDFSRIEVLNPPWPSSADVEAIVSASVTDATNGIPRITESYNTPGWAENADYAQGSANAAVADFAQDAERALSLGNLGESRTFTQVFSQLDAATATNEQQAAELVAVSNNVLAVARQTLRALGDEYVYEPQGMSDFEWSSDRPDILAAVGSSQPYIGYEYDGYCEWHLDFNNGATSYWGYAYAPLNSPEVEFSVDGWYWDDTTYEEHYDSATIVGHRTSQGYDLTDPVDTFAHQSELTTMHGEITALRGLVDGETKVLRTGKAGELGTGWGYVQHPLYGETRRWRIRVPKWGAISGMATNNAAWTRSYSLLAEDGLYNGLVNANGYYSDILLVNPLSFDPRWDLRRTLVETRGVYGADAVAMADWAVGLVLESTNGSSRCLANYHVVQTSTSPMSFAVSPVTTHMTRLDVDIHTPVFGTATLWRRDLVAEPVSASHYGVTSTHNIKAILLDDATTTTTNGTFELRFWTLMDFSYGNSFALTNALVSHVVTVACPSATTFENVYAPYYKLVSTRDSNLYYDAALDESYRIVCSNGVFFSEWYMDGDWRKEDL